MGLVKNSVKYTNSQTEQDTEQVTEQVDVKTEKLKLNIPNLNLNIKVLLSQIYTKFATKFFINSNGNI